MDVFEAYAASVLDGSMVVFEPTQLTVYFENTDESYAWPEGETEAKFLDRIERSKKAGRNLFKEEWPLWEQNYEPGVLY